MSKHKHTPASLAEQQSVSTNTSVMDTTQSLLSAANELMPPLSSLPLSLASGGGRSMGTACRPTEARPSEHYHCIKTETIFTEANNAVRLQCDVDCKATCYRTFIC